jgi:predicted ester cyclase
MSSETNRALLRRVSEEIINTGRLDRAGEFFAADYVEHAPLPPGIPPGVAGFQQFFGALRAAFPDLRYTVDDVVAEGDTVAGRVTVRGTSLGDFLGVPPTGRELSWTEMHIARCAGGKIVEHWAVVDRAAILEQLGAIPAPARAGAPSS